MLQPLSKKQLTDLYITRHLSTWAIEKQYGYSRSFVYKKLLDCKIPLRSLASSHFKSPRTPFNGTIFEKLYIVGFSVGDLRVRLHNKKGRSETISIACSSTKPAQIKLIRELFCQYGYIWEGKPDRRNVVSIEAFVDFSFDFLVGKNWKQYKKTLKGKSAFFAFLAGFSDAEGSIFISRGMATMSWGNYDSILLEYIRRNLKKYNIKTSSLLCDNLKGYLGKDGYRRRCDYYHLNCSRKDSLDKLLKFLKPFMCHGDKIKMLKMALDNIKERNKKFYVPKH